MPQVRANTYSSPKPLGERTETIVTPTHVDGKIVSYRTDCGSGNPIILMEYFDGHVVKFRFREDQNLEFRTSVYGRIHRVPSGDYIGHFQKFEYPIPQ